MDDIKPIIGMEAEQALLGACLHSKTAFEIAQKIVSPDDFCEELHRELWEVMLGIHCEGAEIKPTSVIIRLSNEIKTINIDGMTVSQYLSRLYAEVTSIIDARWIAIEVKKSATRRRIIALSQTIEQKCLTDFKILPSEIAKEAIIGFDDINKSVSINTNPVVDSKQFFANMLQEIEDTQAQDGLIGVTTGLASLDHIIGGMCASDLVILAGRPGMGKSALAGSMMLSAAKQGAGCLFFSLEMSANQLAYRMASEYLYERRRLPYSAIMRGTIDDNAKYLLQSIHWDLSKLPFRIDPTPAISVAQIAIQCRKYKAELMEAGQDLKVVFVDYLQLVKPATSYRGNKVAETTEVSNSLKGLAKELGVCVVALSQLSRSGEQEKDKRPQLHHLRDSGAIEQDANIVIFPFREEYYLKKDNLPVPPNVEKIIELHVAKNRNGEEGRPRVRCDIAYNHFSEIQ